MVVFDQLIALSSEYNHKLRSLGVAELPTSIYAKNVTIRGLDDSAMLVNTKKFSNPERLGKRLDKDIARKFHPRDCTSMESIITHEFGHTLTQNQIAMKQGAFYKEAKKIKARNSREQTKLARKFRREKSITLEEYEKQLDALSISEYAKKDLDEFVAEAFTSYKHSPNPPAIAVEIGKLIDKTFKVKK